MAGRWLCWMSASGVADKIQNQNPAVSHVSSIPEYSNEVPSGQGMEGKCEASPRGQVVGQQGTQGWATQCNTERARASARTRLLLGDHPLARGTRDQGLASSDTDARPCICYTMYYVAYMCSVVDAHLLVING